MGTHQQRLQPLDGATSHHHHLPERGAQRDLVDARPADRAAHGDER